MGDIESEFLQQISHLATKEPKLYAALAKLAKRVQTIDIQLNPLVAQSLLSETEQAAALAAPATFSYSFTAANVKLSWQVVSGASQYEVRKGADWDTATFQFRSNSLEATLDPLTVGSHPYLIKSINSSGVYSATSTLVTVVVPAIAAVVVSASVIDNTVLLSWVAAVTTFAIRHYQIERGAELVGYVAGTFSVITENVAATNTYKVTPIDIVGNKGTTAEISISVNQPPDFALQEEFTSVLDGTRVNARLVTGPKLQVCALAKSWSDHYTVPGWANIAAKMAAGYPLWFNKSSLTASYEEVIDFGVVLTNVIAHVTYNISQVHPTETVSVVIQLATSSDNVIYSAFTPGSNQFFASFRYLKVRLEFTASNDKAMAEVDNLNIRLDVKRENDGGRIEADAADVGGTVVTFNKSFKDVESVTATVASITEPFIVIVDFVDVPNPTSFNVFVMDTTGNRVTKVVEWKARGVV